jgi:hypothetical protein
MANLIALNLSEGSPRKGKGATGRRGAVKIRTGVGAVEILFRPLGRCRRRDGRAFYRT